MDINEVKVSMYWRLLLITFNAYYNTNSISMLKSGHILSFWKINQHRFVIFLLSFLLIFQIYTTLIFPIPILLHQLFCWSVFLKSLDYFPFILPWVSLVIYYFPGLLRCIYMCNRCSDLLNSLALIGACNCNFAEQIPCNRQFDFPKFGLT